MDDTVGEQTNSGRQLTSAFDCQFARLHSRSLELVSNTAIELLYRDVDTPAVPASGSVGENVLRSAAAIEQTFGGITANLWDDPFEWTLPENLSTTGRVIEYLEEVEATRQRAFARFKYDSELSKEVRVPAGNTRPLADLLAETLVKAADYQGRAIATLAILFGGPAAGFKDENISACSSFRAG